MGRLLRILSLVIAPVALAAFPARTVSQAPQITPAGDPSIRADTLYKLAADAKARYGSDPDASHMPTCSMTAWYGSTPRDAAPAPTGR